MTDHIIVETVDVTVVGEVDQTSEVVVIVGDGFLGAILFDLEVFEEVGDEVGEGEGGHGYL